MAALTTAAYQKDWRDEGETGRVEDMCGAYRWRDWLGGAGARYQRWQRVTQSGERPDRAQLAAVEEVECDRGDAVDADAPDHVSLDVGVEGMSAFDVDDAGGGGFHLE